MLDVFPRLDSRVVLVLSLCAAVTACQAPPGGEEGEDFEDVAEAASAEAALTVVDFTREPVSGDIAHYTVVLRVGDAPGAELAIHRVVRERSPWNPRHARDAVMLLHGDFATFPSNFLPGSAGPESPASHGLAGYLAGHGIDVWGVDRRWTRTPAGETDFSGYATMGLAEEIADTERALVFARVARTLTGSGAGRVILGGFSHGGQIAYEYAGVESQKSPAQRHVKALIPIDIYDRIAPEDEPFRQAACESRDDGQHLLDSGVTAGDNGFFALMGQLAETSPDDTSPFFDPLTNLATARTFLARTWVLFAPVPNYHLAGGVLSGDQVTAMRYSPELRLQRWLGAAPAYQSILEGVELDAIWCGEDPRPLPDHLADIQVPIFYLGAAGGFGAHGLYTTTQVGSSDVTTLVVQKLDAAQEREDFGHGDLLYSDEAPALAWDPLVGWIQGH